MPTDDFVNSTVSFQEYSIFVSFYSMDSSYFQNIKSKFNAEQNSAIDQNFHLTNNIHDTMSLVRLVNPSQLANYNADTIDSSEDKTIPCWIEVFCPAVNYSISSPNEKNMQVIFGSIVTNVHASFLESDITKRHHPEFFETGIINRIASSTFKSALFSVRSEHFGEYSHHVEPYPICSYYTDNSSNIISSSYPYANSARFATCSCPSMIAMSPSKDTPVPCLWKDHKDCMMYVSNALIMKEDIIHPKADTSLSLHVKLVQETMNDGSSFFKIYSDSNPVIVFNASSSDFSFDNCLSVYDEYIADVANDFSSVPLQINQNNKSKFLLSLISE